MAKIGVQAMMLKNSFTEIGGFETLRRISAIGYHAVEVSQIPLTADNLADLQRARDELGMDIASLSVTLDAPLGAANASLDVEFDKIVADAKMLDAKMLRIGMLPMLSLRSMDTLHDFTKRANEYAERLAEQGIRLYYHNHHIEFSKYDGKFLLDIIADDSPAVGLEIDVHWVARGGMDPARTIDKYAGRAAMIHLKDYRIGQLPDEAFDLLEKGDNAGWREHFSRIVQFAEVGEGNLDFAAIIEHSLAAGAEYLLVEQDDLYGRTVWEALQTSYDNLVALGHADLF
ncbi:MAG TPA: sugar phosphate isomerase/epimerase [Actinopolymorphaceae bacterium]